MDTEKYQESDVKDEELFLLRLSYPWRFLRAWLVRAHALKKKKKKKQINDTFLRKPISERIVIS